ncbi:MAG: hypothetical protein O6851_06550, partial [Gemmatimonadetes bacterium]|nr:hypothetical protein [Gemmatimonadota bacterium]
MVSACRRVSWAERLLFATLAAGTAFAPGVAVAGEPGSSAEADFAVATVTTAAAGVSAFGAQDTDPLRGITGADRTLSVDEPFGYRVLRGLLGMGFLVGMAWLFTAKRRSVSWSLIAKGLGLQLVFAILVLRTSWGRSFFRVVNDVVIALISYTNQ